MFYVNFLNFYVKKCMKIQSNQLQYVVFICILSPKNKLEKGHTYYIYKTIGNLNPDYMLILWKL